MSRNVIFLDSSYGGKKSVSFQVEDNYLKVAIPKQYVQYLGYEYQCEDSLVADVLIHQTENKKEGKQESGNEWVKSRDANHLFLDESIHKIDQVTDYIEFRFEENKDVTIKNVYIDNRWLTNWRRVIAVFTVFFVLSLLLFCMSFFAQELEVAFCVIALGIGVVLLSGSPISKSVWDEGIHFKFAYTTTFEKEVGASEVLCTMMDDGIMSEVNPPQSFLEYELMINNVDAQADSVIGHQGVQTLPRAKVSPRNIGYIIPGLVFSLGRLLHLKFSLIYMLCKIINLLLYIALVYFAMKKCAIGKKLIFLLALMPTPMFIAASMNRDAILNGCAFLGIGYLLSFLSEEKSVTKREISVFLVSFCVVCAIKPVYAPLMLLLLFVPEQRYESKNTCKIIRVLGLIIGVGIILSLVIPAINPQIDLADTRGGDTSGNRQIQYILSSPGAFLSGFFGTVGNYFTEYLVGRQILGNVGAYGLISEKYVIALLVLLVALTGNGESHLGKKEKMAILVADIVSIFFVWFCMYLAFTPVGAEYVSGVQGRYFIPLLVPVLILFDTDKISFTGSEKKYNVCLYMVVSLFVFQQLFDSIIFQYVV